MSEFSQMNFFENVIELPPNNVLGLSKDCAADHAPNKIDLVIGAYRDNNGKPVVLDCVRDAERHIFDSNPGHEYVSKVYLYICN
jgi:aspartate/tyrosine/aromatic aminotransferase